MNTIIHKYLLDEYNKFSSTHHYILSYSYKGNIYMTFTTNEILPFVTTISKASRNKGMSLRFRPTNKQKELLLAQSNTYVLCSQEFFNEQFKTFKYNNRGNLIEKLITELFNQEWVVDNIPFYEKGDINIKGTEYQIKYQLAQFTTEKQIQHLESLTKNV